MERYLDTALSAKERAQDLLGKMSLEEKMGQVNCLFPYGDHWDLLQKMAEHGIGEVSTLEVRSIKSLEETVQWQRKIQKMVMDQSEHHIPAIFHMEGLCGPFIQDSTSFPSGIGRGSTWDPELEEQVAQTVSRQELACGIPDRLLDEVYGKPFQAAISESGLRGIMPCYCSINGEPASASHKILTDLLRGEMGFDGVCVSDYGAVGNVHNVQHVGESVTDAGYLCMSAGMDMEMQICTGFNEELKERFRSGEADIRILDQAVLRVLEAKFRMGLFEHPFALDGEELKKEFYNDKDREVSMKAALESLVLLKNDGALPLKKEIKKIAVVGCHAKNARSFFGGYTHLSMEEAVHAVANSIAGLKSGSVDGKKIPMVPGTQIQSDETEEFDEILRQQKPGCRSLLEELKVKLPDVEILYSYGYPVAGDDLSHIDEALETVR